MSYVQVDERENIVLNYSFEVTLHIGDTNEVTKFLQIYVSADLK